MGRFIQFAIAAMNSRTRLRALRSPTTKEAENAGVYRQRHRRIRSDRAGTQDSAGKRAIAHLSVFHSGDHHQPGVSTFSIRTGAKGPNSASATACTTSAHSIGDSFRIIQYGDADVMICGGTEAAITPMGIGGFAAMRALSQRNDDPAHACRPWDKDRDGFIVGEGAGIHRYRGIRTAPRTEYPRGSRRIWDVWRRASPSGRRRWGLSLATACATRAFSRNRSRLQPTRLASTPVRGSH